MEWNWIQDLLIFLRCTRENRWVLTCLNTRGRPDQSYLVSPFSELARTMMAICAEKNFVSMRASKNSCGFSVGWVVPFSHNGKREFREQ